MNRQEGGIPQELQDLVAAACDGELSDRQTEQLEEMLLESAAARRYYLLYLHLHGELHWHQAMAGEAPDLAAAAAEGRGVRIPVPAVARPRREQISRLRLIGFCACSLVAVVLLVLAWRAMPAWKGPLPPGPPPATSSAILAGAVQARWAAGSPPPAIGQAFPLDRRLALERGTIEIGHPGGTRVLVEGPSAFRYSPGGQIELEAGRITVVSPGQAELVFEAGGARIEPAGGTIGIAVGQAGVEVHSLDGKAMVRQVRSESGAPRETTTLLNQGEALAWSAGSAEAPRPIRADPGQFASALPDRAPSRSVAKMREAVANHPHLIHHYTFEGTSRLEKCEDKRGAFHLVESVMVAGRGRGSIDYTAQGVDMTTEAIRPHREPQGGNENGVALQSETEFHPPAEMTVELLLRYQVPEDANDETIALAVATRDGDRACGFYVTAVGKGHLSLLLDANANWAETGTVLVPEHWYYVAVTFEAGSQSTVVNAYVLDLAGGERELQHVLENETIPGIPASSRLGIGKGFDYTGAHAYPWSGELDEVALYDAVLRSDELQGHVDLLGGRTKENGPSSP